MVVVRMMVVVPAGCERRACTDKHQEGEENQLLHAEKSSTIRFRRCVY
jgi:hypothetical protein